MQKIDFITRLLINLEAEGYLISIFYLKDQLFGHIAGFLHNYQQALLYSYIKESD
jgi:hypothetical protein